MIYKMYTAKVAYNNFYLLFEKTLVLCVLCELK